MLGKFPHLAIFHQKKEETIPTVPDFVTEGAAREKTSVIVRVYYDNVAVLDLVSRLHAR